MSYPLPLMLMCDGYKLDHRRMLPDKTTGLFGNLTARSSRIEGVDSVVFFGLQYFLKRYFQEIAQETFFGRPIDDVTTEYQNFLDSYLGANDIGTAHIAAVHELGYFPLDFWAVPEGTPVPLRMPFFVVQNTHPEFAWLTLYFETLLSSTMWQAITSATTAWQYRQTLDHYTAEQGTDPLFVDWQAHDFSFRGLAGVEAAALSGAAHLISFTGTDSIPAIQLIEKYYGCSGLIGGSVPASEHSVMSAGGNLTEQETYEHIIDLYPGGIVSIVSDTYDLWKVLMEIMPAIKDKIMARDGKVVIRPDSGDPVKIMCGDPDAPEGTPEHKGAVELLWEVFGGTTNARGYRTLDPHIGLIYGDSITLDRINRIAEGWAKKGFAIANGVFGIGSYTYQFVTRDVYGMAMKATSATIDGVEHMLWKDPVTDTDKTKKSAKGRVSLNYDERGQFVMTDGLSNDEWLALVTHETSAYQQVWIDGRFINDTNFDSVRNNLQDWT